MADMKLEPKHNVAAFLDENCLEAVEYENMIRFLLRTKYVYAMCVKPIMYKRLIRTFWRTATLELDDMGNQVIRGFISNERMIEVSETSIRTALNLGENAQEDPDILPMNVCKEVFISMGHPNEFPKQQFVRARLWYHWKLLCFIFQHCLSKRSAGFNSFSYELASPIVALITNQPFNMAKWILNGFVFNLTKGSKNKFLMYPRFLQLIINEEYPDIAAYGLNGERITLEDMSKEVYQRLAVITNAQNTPLFRYIIDVSNDTVNMNVIHHHLIDEEPINPKDLIQLEPEVNIIDIAHEAIERVVESVAQTHDEATSQEEKVQTLVSHIPVASGDTEVIESEETESIKSDNTEVIRLSDDEHVSKESSLEITKATDIIDVDEDSTKIKQLAEDSGFANKDDEIAHYLLMIHNIQEKNELLEKKLIKKESVIEKYKANHVKNTKVFMELNDAFEKLAEEHELVKAENLNLQADIDLLK